MKLPNRRPCITETVDYNGEKLHVTKGLYPDSENPWLPSEDIGEVFAYGPKVGSGHYAILQERCVEASKRLQDGADPADFLPYIERDADGHPVTIWGAVVDVLNSV